VKPHNVSNSNSNFQ